MQLELWPPRHSRMGFQRPKSQQWHPHRVTRSESKALGWLRMFYDVLPCFTIECGFCIASADSLANDWELHENQTLNETILSGRPQFECWNSCPWGASTMYPFHWISKLPTVKEVYIFSLDICTNKKTNFAFNPPWNKLAVSTCLRSHWDNRRNLLSCSFRVFLWTRKSREFSHEHRWHA